MDNISVATPKKLIGKGFFTRCYDTQDGRVELHTFCNIKPAYAEWGVGDGRLFPVMEKIDTRYDRYDNAISVLTCKKFPKVSSLKSALKPAHYALYRTLKSIAYRNVSTHDFYRAVKDSKSIHHAYKTDILTAIDDIHNYASFVGVEISPRNVAVDGGRLVLLDIFFDRDQVKAIRTNKVRKPVF